MVAGVPDLQPLNAWSPLSHYALVSNPAGYNLAVRSWVPKDDRTRLGAYFVLDSYRKNVARNLLKTRSYVRRHKHREYGHANLLGTRIRSGVLGDDFELVVPGADDDLPDAPDLPDRPTEPEPDPATGTVDEVDRRIYDIQIARWTDAAARAIDEWEDRIASQPDLQARQTEMRDWADRMLLPALMVEAEDDCVHLGDTVYVLWPTKGGWPRVDIYEPDGYFPVLDRMRDGYPTKVHLAWEEEHPGPDNTVKRYVRRLTWELVEIGSLRGEFADETDTVASTDLADGERLVTDADGMVRVGRVMPWTVAEGDDQAPALTFETCIHTEGLWDLDNIGLGGVTDLADSAAVGGVDRIDLGVDFLPVIHIPNTPASRDHYGQSALAIVAQLLDDIGQTDTDLMETARLVAGPAIALSGAESKDQIIKPLTIFNLGLTGKMDVLDLSTGLDRMMAFGDRLADQLFVSAHVPATLVGKVNSSDAPSGIAMLLDAAPFAQLIGTLRMAREPKYRLLLKFAQRLAQVQQVLDPGPTFEARVAFGSFLPLDRGQVVDHVVALLAAKAISRSTAITLLVAGGFPIDDARRVLDEIASEDFTGAATLADALGSEQAAADYMGRDIPDTGATEPTVNLPPTPGAPPAPAPPPEVP
jgi:hypothetical protein